MRRASSTATWPVFARGSYTVVINQPSRSSWPSGSTANVDSITSIPSKAQESVAPRTASYW